MTSEMTVRAEQSTDRTEIEELLRVGPYEIREALSKNRNTPADVLWSIAEDAYRRLEAGEGAGAVDFTGMPDWELEETLLVNTAGHFNAPMSVLPLAARYPRAQRVAIWHPHISAGLLHGIVTEWLDDEAYDWYVEQTICTLGKTEPGTLVAVFNVVHGAFSTDRALADMAYYRYKQEDFPGQEWDFEARGPWHAMISVFLHARTPTDTRGVVEGRMGKAAGLMTDEHRVNLLWDIQAIHRDHRCLHPDAGEWVEAWETTLPQ